MRRLGLTSVIILLFVWFISPWCVADPISPTIQFQGIANQMIVQLETHKSELSNINVIRKIVNKTLLPTVDVDRMSASVVGSAWRTASAAQRRQFQKEFADLVTTTYASALSSYDGDKVVFQPIRGGYVGRQALQLNSVIVRRNGQRIPITYDIALTGNQWKVYDFSIEHVSMAQSYRSQFAGVLAQGGMPALLARLQTHNQASS